MTVWYVIIFLLILYHIMKPDDNLHFICSIALMLFSCLLLNYFCCREHRTYMTHFWLFYHTTLFLSRHSALNCISPYLLIKRELFSNPRPTWAKFLTRCQRPATLPSVHCNFFWDINRISVPFHSQCNVTNRENLIFFTFCFQKMFFM